MSGSFRIVDSGFGGGNLSTPHRSDLVITGDLDLRFRCTRDDIAASSKIIVYKSDGTLAAGTYNIVMYTTGLYFSARIGGVERYNDGFCDISTALWPLFSARWLRLTRDASTGVYSWWVNADQETEPREWGAVTHTMVGTAGAVVPAGTDGLYLGGAPFGTSPNTFTLHEAIVRDGIDGRVAFRTGPYDVPVDAPGYTSLSGHPMSITGHVELTPATEPADRLQQMPDASHGAPVGIGDWMFSVEVLLPLDTSSLWGSAVWGESQWSTNEWHDITASVRGLAWGRGNDEPYGRPRVGTGQLTLSSLEDEWSPWNPSPPLGSAAYFAPGTIIRAGLRSETDTRGYGWLPQFTMLVDKWPIAYVGANGVDRFVDISLVETGRDLAQIDDNSIGSLVGGGEDPAARLTRLLEQTGWLYGLTVEAQHVLSAPSSYPLQSTDMADNRLAECYLTADSCDATFRSDKKGSALLCAIEYQTEWDADPAVYPMVDFSCFDAGAGVRSPGFGVDWYERTATAALGDRLYLPYRLDTLTTVNDDDNVVNDARFARVGGTQQVFEQDASISRYGRRTSVRSDLICTTDAYVLELAELTTIRRGLNVMRVASVDIDTLDRGDVNALVMFALDTQIPVRCYTPDGVTIVADPDRPYITGFVGALEHMVEMGSHRVKQWQTRFSIDTRTVENLPGAQLPAT